MRGCSWASADAPAEGQLSASWRRSLMRAGQTRTPPPVASFIQPCLLQVARQTRHFLRAPPPPLSKQSVNHFAPRYEASPKESTSRARSLNLASHASRFFLYISARHHHTYQLSTFVLACKMASSKIFSLEGKGLKLDTAEDIEPHLAPLCALDDVEEVRFWGNTLGVGACKRLGEVLSTKKSLKVCALPKIAPYLVQYPDNLTSPVRQLRRPVHRPTAERDSGWHFRHPHRYPEPPQPYHRQP